MKENPFNVIFKKKEFLFPYRHALAEFPYYVDIELTNHCNLDCIMCSRQIMKRRLGYMDMDLYKKIINEVKANNSAVRFARWGEPTLYPELDKVLFYAKDCGVLTYVSTNAYTGAERMRRLYEAKPDVIRFSFQGTYKETFERFRWPAVFDVVARNIRLISNLRAIDRSYTPYLIVSTTLTTETAEEQLVFEKYWLAYVDAVDFGKTLFSRLGKEDTIEKIYKPCTEVLTKLSIDWNGDISACCSDYDKFLVIGNLQDMSLKEAWHNPKLEELRGVVGEKLLHSSHSYCKDCFIETSKFDKLKMGEQEGINARLE